MKKFFHVLFVEPTDKLYLQLFRYGFVGATAFAVDYSTMIFLTEIVGLMYLLSAALSFTFGLIVNYLLSISWVFNSNRKVNPKMEFIIFALIGIAGLGLNELIMYISTDGFDIHYMVSKLISTVIVFFWNFLARRLILFTKKI